MNDHSFLYFAYGSNMLTERLHVRAPSARPLSAVVARGFTLSFSKRSVDGSAKATLVVASDGTSIVPGVLFEIARSDLPRLDAAEGTGKGYDRHGGLAVTRIADGSAATVTTYIAPPHARDERLQPYDWYLALTLAGALQHGLPETHIAMLRRIVARPDPELLRQTRQEALAVLRLAGFDRLLNIGK